MVVSLQVVENGNTCLSGGYVDLVSSQSDRSKHTQVGSIFVKTLATNSDLHWVF